MTAAKPMSLWREPSRAQWITFLAAWLGWVLDAFDFTVFLLVMAALMIPGGKLTERYGRVRMFRGGLVVYGVGVIKVYFQKNANVINANSQVTAISQTQLAMESMVAVRDKVISAYEEIMRMPI